METTATFALRAPLSRLPSKIHRFYRNAEAEEEGRGRLEELIARDGSLNLSGAPRIDHGSKAHPR